MGRSSGAPVPSRLTNEQSVTTSILVVSVSEMSKSHLFFTVHLLKYFNDG